MEQPPTDQPQEPQEDPILAQERAYQEGLFKMLFSTPKETYVPEELAKAIPATEQYITSLRFLSNGKCDILAVSNSKIYKLSDTFKKKWAFPTRDVYRVKIVDGKTLNIDFLKKVNNDGVVLDQKTFTCYEENEENYQEFLVKDSNLTCEVFKSVISSLALESWQAYFESKIMPSPDIYQAHYFGHRKGDKKKICIALSDKRLFITDIKGSADPAGTKDIAPYEFIQRLNTADDILTVTISTSIRTLPEVGLVFFEKECYDNFVYRLQALYFYDRKVKLEKISKQPVRGRK